MLQTFPNDVENTYYVPRERHLDYYMITTKLNRDCKILFIKTWAEYMKTHTRSIYWISLVVVIIYFILRIIYGIWHIKIANQISLILSIIISIAMFIIALISFFHEKRRKEALQAFILFIILGTVNIFDYLLK